MKTFIRKCIEKIELLLLRSLFPGKRRSAGADAPVVIIQNAHVGDFLISMPFFERVKQYFDRPVIFISDRRIKELAENCGLFSGFVEVDMRSVSSVLHPVVRWQTFLAVKKINALAVIRSWDVGANAFMDLLAAAVPAVEKYAMADSLQLKKLYTSLHLYDRSKGILENETAFADHICGDKQVPQVGNLEYFEPLPLPDIQRYCLIVPGADDLQRRWEAEKFVFLIRNIAEKSGLKIILSGAPSEIPLLESIYAVLDEKIKKQVIIRYPLEDRYQSFLRLFSDVKHAEFIVTNETGPVHIAAKYGVKTVCICGNWHFGIFVPAKLYTATLWCYENVSCRNCGGRCSYKTVPFECLHRVNKERVWQVIESECLAGN